MSRSLFRSLFAVTTFVATTTSAASFFNDAEVDASFDRVHQLVNNNLIPHGHEVSNIKKAMQPMDAFQQRLASVPQLKESILSNTRELEELNRRGEFNVQAFDPVACVTDATAFAKVFENCTSSFTSPTSATASNPFAAFSTNLINSICANTCLNNLKTSLTTTMAACGIAGSTNSVTSAIATTVTNLIANYNQLSEILAVGCVTDDTGAYCLPQFFNSYTTIAALVTNHTSLFTFNGVTTQVLNTVCTTCMQKVGTILSAYTGVDRALGLSLNLLCSKDGETNNYCIPALVNSALPTTSTGAFSSKANDYLTAASGTLCSSCFRRLYQASLAIAQVAASASTAGIASLITTDPLEKALDTLCSINSATGARCLDALTTIRNGLASTASPFVSGVCPTITSTSTTVSPSSAICPASCKTQIETFIAPLGCCLNNLLALVASDTALIPTNSISSTVVQTVLSGFPIFLASCGVNVANCGAAANGVTASIVIPSISLSIYQTASAALKISLIQDLAIAIGTSTASINITSVVAATSPATGIVITFTISVSTSADGTAVAATLNGSAGVSFAVTKTVLQSSASQLTADAIVSSSNVAKVAGTTTGAATMTVHNSIFTLLLAMIFAFVVARVSRV